MPQEHQPCSFVADRSIDWLRGYKQEKPFFLWVSFIEPHPPILDSPRWTGHYKNCKIAVGPVTMPGLPDNAWGRYLRTWIQNTGTGNLTPEIVAEVARHYYGMISLIDQKIGDIFKTVEDLGMKNTWVIYTADHGEMMGDQKMMYKNVFYRGSVRVPNIIRPPAGMKAQNGEWTGGIDRPDRHHARPRRCAHARMPGPLAAARHQRRQDARRGAQRAGRPSEQANFFVAAFNERYRYTHDKQNKLACELFDLEKDHDEMHNLVDDTAYAGIRKDMHKDYVEEFMK